jgi:hypothetical protein
VGSSGHCRAPVCILVVLSKAYSPWTVTPTRALRCGRYFALAAEAGNEGCFELLSLGYLAFISIHRRAYKAWPSVAEFGSRASAVLSSSPERHLPSTALRVGFFAFRGLHWRLILNSFDGEPAGARAWQILLLAPGFGAHSGWGSREHCTAGESPTSIHLARMSLSSDCAGRGPSVCAQAPSAATRLPRSFPARDS